MENTSKYFSPQDAVSVVRMDGYAEVDEAKKKLTELIAPLCDLSELNGKRVVIKANLVSAMKPEEAATTHPVLLSALTELLIENGAEVTLGDSPGGLYTAAFVNRVYNVSGNSVSL